MKLLTYESGSGPRCGVIRDDEVVDVTALLGGSRALQDVKALLELDESAIDRVRDALAANPAAQAVPLEGLRLRSPVLQPPTVRDFMVFEEHATAQGTREREEAWYRMPIFYFSNTLCIYGPDDHVPFPSVSQMLDYELELGCVIGKNGRNVAEADALDYIAGFCIFNDWSCRDIQRDESVVGLGPAKGKDSASSLGPLAGHHRRDGALLAKRPSASEMRSQGQRRILAERRRRRHAIPHLGGAGGKGFKGQPDSAG